MKNLKVLLNKKITKKEFNAKGLFSITECIEEIQRRVKDGHSLNEQMASYVSRYFKERWFNENMVRACQWLIEEEERKLRNEVCNLINEKFNIKEKENI